METENKPRGLKPDGGRAARVVRDGFSMPPDEYALIAEWQSRLMREGLHVTKSGILRAGLRLLEQLTVAEGVTLVESLETVKTGRPSSKDDE